MVDYAGTVSGLSAWLEQQADNTPSTAYTIQCSEDLTYVALGNAIRPHTTKYVDLSPTMWNEEESGYAWVGAFKNCVNLVIAPIMYPGPRGVISCREMFMGCTSLKGLSSSIPQNIQDTTDMFNGCTSFSPSDYEGVNFPSALQNMTRMFQDCTSLVELKMPLSTSHYVKIPTGVDTTDAFKNCTSLVYAPDLNNPLRGTTYSGTCNYFNTFVNCPNAAIYCDLSASGAPTLHELLTRQGGGIQGFNSYSTIDSPIPFELVGTSTSALATEFYENEGATYVDLSRTTVSVTWITGQSGGMIASGDFGRWYNMVVSPNISNYYQSNVEQIAGLFEDCRCLKKITKQIESGSDGWRYLTYTYKGCENLEEIEITGTWKLYGTFEGCTRLTDVTLASSIIVSGGAFKNCTSLVEAPYIADPISESIDLDNAFEGCTSLEYVPNIPKCANGYGSAVSAFEGCTNLKRIGRFGIPINYLKSSSSFQNMFKDCPNLEHIGLEPEEASDWHIFRLKFGNNTVEGKVFDKNKNATTISSTSITKSQLVLPVLSDELLFTNSISDSDLDDLIENVIEYKYTYFGNENRTIDPTNKSFVLWAEDTDHVVTNLSFPADVSHASGVLPVANGGTGRTTTANGAWYTTAANETSPTIGTLPVAQGGTGQTTLAAARNAMGLGNTTGALPIANGGTESTTASGACTNLIGALTVATGDVTDDTDVITANANGYAEQSDKTIYKRKGIRFWNYIKSKIQNVGSLVIGIASTVGTKLKLKGMTYGTNTYADNNPKVVFENTDASQNISLTFTDFDAVQSPASLTLNGNQGGEYFIAPNVKATSSVYVGSEVVNSADNNSSWWLNKNPRGKFKGTNGGSASGWSPLLAGKTVNGKYELGSLNNTIYLNYYKDSRTTNGIDKTIFDYTVDGTPNWNGNASTASTATNSDKVDGYHASTVGPSGASQLNALVPIQYQYQQSVVGEANWIVFANGFKIMWGTKERGSSLTKGSTWTVGQSLAIMPFSSANYSITFTCESSTVGGEELSVYDKTATGFTLGMYNRNSGTTIVSPKFHWVAMGW